MNHKKGSETEKAVRIINAVLFAGMILFFLSYCAGYCTLGKDICWLLFCLHFFINAILFWKENRDKAIENLIYGCIMLPFVVISWLFIILL